MGEYTNALVSALQGASNAAASNISGPVDLIAWALRKAGVPVPSNPVMGSDWMRQKGLLAEPQSKMAGLLGEGLGMAAPAVAAAKAPQIARGLLNVADDFQAYNKALGPAGVSQATVWHGSPHKFDRFDSSKIGTGEGAQAYGHGLYLADAKDVANAYQYNLGYKAGNVPKVGGVEIGDFYNKVSDRANRLPPAMASKEYDKLAMLEDLMGEQATPAQVLQNAAQRGYPQHAVDWFKAHVVPKYESPGNLYKVDLPDPLISRMLDWDKPLSQQAPEVQAAVKPLLKDAFDIRPYRGGWGSLEPDPSALREIFSKSGTPLGMYSAADTAALNLPGSTVVKALGKGDRESWKASETLRQAGIPGIRYLDGGSRGAGAGTSNYVLFPGEESALTILERNGSPVNALVQALRGPR